MAHAIIGLHDYGHPSRLIVVAYGNFTVPDSTWHVVRGCDVAIPFAGEDVSDGLYRLADALRSQVSSPEEATILNESMSRMSAQWGRPSVLGRYVDCSLSWAGRDDLLWAELGQMGTRLAGTPFPVARLQWLEDDGDERWVPVVPAAALPSSGRAGRRVQIFVEDTVCQNRSMVPEGVRRLGITPELNEIHVRMMGVGMLDNLRRQERYAHAKEDDLLELAMHIAAHDEVWYSAWLYSPYDSRSQRGVVNGTAVCDTLRLDGLPALADALSLAVNGTATWVPWAESAPTVLDLAGCSALRQALLIDCLLQSAGAEYIVTDHKVAVLPSEAFTAPDVAAACIRGLRLGRKYNLNFVCCSDDHVGRSAFRSFVGGAILMGSAIEGCRDYFADLEWSFIGAQAQASSGPIVHIVLSEGAWMLVGAAARLRRLMLRMSTQGLHYRICLVGGTHEAFTTLLRHTDRSKGIFNSESIPEASKWQRVQPGSGDESGIFAAIGLPSATTDDSQEGGITPPVIQFSIDPHANHVCAVDLATGAVGMFEPWGADRIADTGFFHYLTKNPPPRPAAGAP